jgi:type VI secretion system protein ImpC
MKFEFTFRRAPTAARPAPDVPFRVLVLGDFDGRTSRGRTEPLAGRRPVRVDIDTLGPFFERLGAEIQVAVPGAPAPARIAIAEPDDLHPDRLVERVELFAALRRTRQRLLDRSTFESAAAEVRAWTGESTAAPGDAGSASTGSTGRDSDSETLERLLGRGPTPATAVSPAASGTLSELIRPMVSQHVVSPPPTDQRALLATVDEAMGARMRQLLHAPAFQSIESAWRALDFLVRRVESSESLQIFVLNLSSAELSADLTASDDLEQTTLFRILVESAGRSPGADPWAVILGLYPFGLGEGDLESLARMAALAHLAGAPFVAGASGEMLQAALDGQGRIESHNDWRALRARPEAAYLGLAAPRFLLRLPYGRATDPISAFVFEECAEPPDHESYLWAPPALALGVHFAEMFAQSGWDMSPGGRFELGDLPVHVRKEGRETAMMPCAEMWLSDSQAEALLRRGLIPLQSIRGKDAVRVAAVRSAREPAGDLAGRWS